MDRRAFVLSVLSGLFMPRRSRFVLGDDSMSSVDFYKSGYISDPVFLQHHIAAGHPESPDRIQYIQNAIQTSGWGEQLTLVGLKPDVERWITTVHTETHITSIKTHAPLAHKVASAAVGACLSGIDKLLCDRLDNVFCAVRPPGHHALNTGQEEGFCYYNNIAIAARYAQQQYGLKKILIVDWDYHHGNATEAMFYNAADVLFFSTHDQYAYPGTGDPAKKGAGKGYGYNINVHLDCGAKDENIIEVFNTVLVVAADEFKPELVLVSAGFDSRENDPLGCFDITDEGFFQLTKIVMRIADEHCQGKMLSVLEGGYNLSGNASAVLAHLSALKKR